MSSKKNSKGERPKMIGVRLAPEWHDRLGVVADSERRTLANMVEKIVADYLEAQDGAGAPRALKKIARP